MQESTSNSGQPDRLLRLPDVEALVGLRKSSIYDAMKRGGFPAAVKLSRRSVCWSALAIQAWIAKRIEAGGR